MNPLKYTPNLLNYTECNSAKNIIACDNSNILIYLLYVLYELHTESHH